MNKYKQFWQIINLKQKKDTFKLLILTLIGGFLEAGGIALIVPLISVITSESFLIPNAILTWLPSLINSTRAELLIYVSSAFIGFYLFKSLFIFCLSALQTRFYINLQQSTSERLYSSYLSKPYAYHLENNSAKLLSHTVTESSQFAIGFTSPAILIVNDILVVASILGILLFADPIGAISAMIILGSLSFFMYSLSKKRASLWGETRQAKEIKRIESAQQGLSGIKDIKLYGREKIFFNKYAQNTHISLDAGRKQTVLQAIPRIFLEFAAVLALCSLIIISSAQGDTANIMSTIALFAAAAFKLLPTIARLVVSSQQVSFASSVVDLIFTELVLERPNSKNEIIKNRIDFKTVISISNLNFTYENSINPALESISLNIKSGEMVGFIGSSGAGKSTLIDCFLGLIQPSSGQILVDDQVIDTSNMSSWQQKIGYVSQVLYLLDGTLRDNIAFGIPSDEIDDKNVLRAIEHSQMVDFISSLPDGLDTIVGERGVRLSGGQRQRIGIARALYNDPKILVLDEATSSLDTSTEKELMKSVESLHGTKTILIIAHRYSTIENCDYLYHLEKGKIVDSGRPSQILKKLDQNFIISEVEKNNE